MTDFSIDLDNNELTVAANDTITVHNVDSVYLMIAAVGADVTVSIQLITGGLYRDLDLTVTDGTVKTTTHKIPRGVTVKFSAAAEVLAYA